MVWKKVFGDIKNRYDDYAENARQEREIRNKVRQEDEVKRQKYENAVNTLLDKFEIPDFDKFLMRFLNKKPESETEYDKETGRSRTINPGRRDYLDFLWNHLNKDEINFNQLKEFRCCIGT